VFATIAIRDGRLLDGEAHVRRLVESAQVIGLPVPEAVRDADRLCDVLGLLGAARQAGGLVRVQISGDGGGRGFGRGGSGSCELVELHPLPAPRILRVRVLDEGESPVPTLPAIKSCSALAHVLCAAAAERRGVADAVRTAHGVLLEASSSNVFWTVGDTLFTPADTLPLYPGVTRAATIEAARSSGWTVREGEFRVSALTGIDGAFLTNAARGVEPIAELDGEPVPWPAALKALRTAVEASRFERGHTIPDPDRGTAPDRIRG
jgi:branched-subunit amino acid aminotransferase/4-amino-4-deoxychorismate lyase